MHIQTRAFFFFFSAKKKISTILIKSSSPDISKQKPNVICYSLGYMEAHVREVLKNEMSERCCVGCHIFPVGNICLYVSNVGCEAETGYEAFI